jgi:hypothetical protein
MADRRFHLAGASSTDQSFIMASPVCLPVCQKKELGVLLREALTADEFAGITNLCVIPRIKVQGWSATEWCNCTNRDLWESIAYLLDEYKSAGTSFRVFHNKAHPENWKSDISEYSALEMVAHLTDSIVAIVKEEVVDQMPPPLVHQGAPPGRPRELGCCYLGCRI